MGRGDQHPAADRPNHYRTSSAAACGHRCRPAHRLELTEHRPRGLVQCHAPGFGGLPGRSCVLAFVEDRRDFLRSCAVVPHLLLVPAIANTEQKAPTRKLIDCGDELGRLVSVTDCRCPLELFVLIAAAVSVRNGSMTSACTLRISPSSGSPATGRCECSDAHNIQTRAPQAPSRARMARSSIP